VRLLRDARTLRDKSITSLKAGMAAFNSYNDEGRVTTVLLHLQHACEMLIKAVLVQNKHKVFDNKTNITIGLDKSIRICQSNHGLSDDEAGAMRTIDALRDSAQHWFVFVSEDILYLNTRALITAYDSYIKRTLGDDIHSHIPPRVLPVSTKPPGDFEFLVDREYSLVMDLLNPGRRKRDEARARIRSMLAMEAVVAEGVHVTERDVDRVEKAIKAGKPFSEVFPRLTTVGTYTDGEGVSLTVRFSKKEGAPIRHIGGDDPTEAAAIRDVDLRKKYYLRPKGLADKLGINPMKSKALRDYLGIDADATCYQLFQFEKTKLHSYSDNAVNKMQKALEDGKLDEAWANRKR